MSVIEFPKKMRVRDTINLCPLRMQKDMVLTEMLVATKSFLNAVEVMERNIRILRDIKDTDSSVFTASDIKAWNDVLSIVLTRYPAH